MDAREIARKVREIEKDDDLPRRFYGGMHHVLTEDQATNLVAEALSAQAEEIERIRARPKHDIIFIDATPDEGYIRRILEAYIDDSEWTDNTMGLPAENPLIHVLNEAQAKRNKMLREAIQALAPAPTEKEDYKEPSN